MYLLPGNFNQKGFAPIALVVLLLLGIGAGTFLVQNRTNFLPKAADLCSPISQLCEKQGKVCKVTPDGEPICVRVTPNQVAVCTPEIILGCDQKGQMCRVNANNQPECYSPAKNTPCTPEIILSCDSKGQTCVTNQYNEPICVNRTSIGKGSCSNSYGGAEVGKAWTGSCSLNVGYRVRYHCSSNENITEGAIRDDKCNLAAPIGGCKNSFGGYAVNTWWDGSCSDRPGYRIRYYCSDPDTITEVLRNDDICTPLASTGQPATITKKTECMEAQEAGADIKGVCNLDKTTYCDNATILITRSGGNCATSNQIPDDKGCAYVTTPKTCGKCVDPGSGKAECVSINDPRPAAQPAAGARPPPIPLRPGEITPPDAVPGSTVGSTTTGCENFKDAEGIISIPCYKIGVFTPEDLRATEAQAKIALERYTQYKQILSEVEGKINSEIEAKAKEKIEEAEKKANACIAQK